MTALVLPTHYNPEDPLTKANDAHNRALRAGLGLALGAALNAPVEDGARFGVFRL